MIVNYDFDEFENFKNALEENEYIIIPPSIKTKTIYKKILKSNSWIDNTQSRPDLINHELKMWVEVMKVDDHSSNGKDNPYRALISKQKESLKQIGFSDETLKCFLFIPQTNLPTDDDHSYKKYLNGFLKTTNKHLNKISEYNQNFPNYKKIFLVLDESSGLYYELQGRTRIEEKAKKTNLHFNVKPHIFFLDKKFMENLLKSDLDYLIWYCPYKRDPKRLDNFKQPRLVFIDLKKISSKQLLLYDEAYMISNEL